MISIAGALILKEDKILLIKRKDRDFLELPGKIVENGEDPENAALKATLQKTGLTIEILQHFNETQSYYDGKEYLSHIYEAKILKGTPTPSDEIEKIEFIDISQIPKLKVAHNVEQIYKELSSQR